jgi:copper homeostasis protein
MKKLEIACFSLEDALRAAELSAHRIEFCEDYNTGGITPNLSDFKILREQFPNIPIHVMVRPRAGNFVHSHSEIQLMQQQITSFNDLGADGFVFGILNEQNQINRSACQQLISIANGKPCVFHRAFDLLPNAFTALEELIELGFSGVLSSGSPTTAIAGLDTLKSLHLQSQNRFQIVAGGGIRANNIAPLIDSDLQWFHSAAWDKEQQLLDEQELVEILKKIQQLAAD